MGSLSAQKQVTVGIATNPNRQGCILAHPENALSSALAAPTATTTAITTATTATIVPVMLAGSIGTVIIIIIIIIIIINNNNRFMACRIVRTRVAG